jgi:hypothetical protein
MSAFAVPPERFAVEVATIVPEPEAEMLAPDPTTTAPVNVPPARGILVASKTVQLDPKVQVTLFTVVEAVADALPESPVST